MHDNAQINESNHHGSINQDKIDKNPNPEQQRVEK
jgi:hypothetical protein